MFDRTFPCGACGKELPADRPEELILGRNAGVICDACRPGKTDEFRLGLLRKAGVPEQFLSRIGEMRRLPYPANAPWVLIQGAVGTGKTWLAVELLLAVKDPREVRFVDWPGFMADRQASIGHDEREDPMLALRRFRGLVVLDDLGRERSGDWATESVNLLLCQRYNDAAKTVITTNLSLSAISELYGDRVSSRINGSISEVWQPKWKKDRRKRIEAAA